MLILGSHVNFGSDQILGSTKQALSYGANTFMFYTGAPQNTIRKALEAKYTQEAIKLMTENGIDINKVICHAPYIINLANKDNLEAWNFSCEFLKKEVKRVEELGVKYIVVHPGNFLKQEVNVALANIAEALNKILAFDTKAMILLETMAGKGTECGRNMEEIKYILDRVNLSDKVGVCLDTCHLNDSGIDISKFDEYLDAFNELIGLEKIKCIHVNDSKNECGSHKDRHANIGFGTIGFENLIKVIYNPKLENIPKILETPWVEDVAPYKVEIAMIKNKTFNPNMMEELPKEKNLSGQ